jgi:hypothetical protein
MEDSPALALEAAFLDLRMQVWRVQFDMSHTLLHAARAFDKALQKALPPAPFLRGLFLQQYHSDLRTIKEVLVKAASSDPAMRSVHDRIFNTLRLGTRSAQPLPITLFFEDFIKGITTFADQGAPGWKKPVYHRLTSCGDGAPDFRTRFNQCHPGMTRKARYAVRKQIERCYVERLIYDAIYIQQTLFFPDKGTAEPAQDAAHRAWLAQTHADFKTCFPTVDVRVTVDAFDGLMPTQMTIARIRRGAVTTIETYRRHTVVVAAAAAAAAALSTVPSGMVAKQYSPRVECTLQTAKGVEKRKVQQFAKAEAWEVYRRPDAQARGGRPQPTRIRVKRSH